MNNELRIKIFSYDHLLLDSFIKSLLKILEKENAKIKGPIPLKTRKEIFTILRSPHVNKSSREQFERKTHKRLVIIENANPAIMNSLKKILPPIGIKVSIK
jgi:small subunit ribosomal protein S10